ncbi:hypothetical protein [Actinomadura flavalba]|uniref:hypothetical protein n=1 Tax=Actinomadura flavalba TaxID=1120938 RepID=UPI00039C0087|nr:hypothetical protein [Actinomadura flavalba]
MRSPARPAPPGGRVPRMLVLLLGFAGLLGVPVPATALAAGGASMRAHVAHPGSRTAGGEIAAVVAVRHAPATAPSAAPAAVLPDAPALRPPAPGFVRAVRDGSRTAAPAPVPARGRAPPSLHGI